MREDIIDRFLLALKDSAKTEDESDDEIDRGITELFETKKVAEPKV